MDSAKQMMCPKKLVMCLDHAKQAEEIHDIQQTGQEYAARYYHIFTPLKKSDLVMYRFDLEGYAYGAAQPLDITWCGYNYNAVNDKPSNQVNYNRNKDIIQIQTISQYYRGGNLVLLFGPINRYCNGFCLYYQGHYHNFMNGMNLQSYKVIVTASGNPIS